MNEKNTEDQNINSKKMSLKLNKEIKSIFALLQGLICLYFLCLLFAGVINKITDGYLFGNVSWIKLLFYVISSVSSFYFFTTYEEIK